MLITTTTFIFNLMQIPSKSCNKKHNEAHSNIKVCWGVWAAKFQSGLQHKINSTAGVFQFHFLLLNHNDLSLSQCYLLLKYEETTE